MMARRWQFVLLALALASSAMAYGLHPRHKIADQGPKVELAAMVPQRFGDWTELPQSGAQIVNPQQTELINRIYTETLSHIYVNGAGERIMLTIAYGASQSDGVALHYPEICYPAQGFALSGQQLAQVDTAYGPIAVKRLATRLGSRAEPVTYWATLGNTVVRGAWDTKMTQMGFGFRGQIPDGLLFRVSSISEDAPAAYALQQRFVNDLMPALSAHSRLKLAGLPATPVR